MVFLGKPVFQKCRGKKNFPKPKVFSSVQSFSCVRLGSLQPHGLQQARPPCPSPTPRVYSNSHPSSQ